NRGAIATDREMRSPKARTHFQSGATPQEKMVRDKSNAESAIQKGVSWENDLKALGLGPTAEQFLHCKKERLVLVKDGVDLIDDRRIHAEATGAFKRALGRRYSFCHHLHIGLDLGQHFGVAQPFAHPPIAAVFAE